MSEEITIRYAESGDKEFWFTFDGHMSADMFDRKVSENQCYLICINSEPVGILRYNLFWDNTPFCNLLYINDGYRRKGLGKILLDFWENDVKGQGYNSVMTSTQSNEEAQHFYRKSGYRDCGVLLLDNEPSELFFRKDI